MLRLSVVQDGHTLSFAGLQWIRRVPTAIATCPTAGRRLPQQQEEQEEEEDRTSAACRGCWRR